MIDLLEKIREWIYQNESLEVYRCEIFLSKNNDDLVEMRRTVCLGKGIYPSRRKIAKLFEDDIKKHIFKRDIKNAIIVVNIISKIGTFKRKDTK